MNKPSSAKGSSSLKGVFLLCIGVFVVSTLAFFLVLRFSHHIEKTSGKVIETYTKKAFVSRKSSYEQQYYAVTYSVKGRDYTKNTKSNPHFSRDVIPVYYYAPFPGGAWFYKKENPNVAYCCIFMLLSLVGIITMRPRPDKSKSPKVTQQVRRLENNNIPNKP